LFVKHNYVGHTVQLRLLLRERNDLRRRMYRLKCESTRAVYTNRISLLDYKIFCLEHEGFC